jgi:hypothetical protein
MNDQNKGKDDLLGQLLTMHEVGEKYINGDKNPPKEKNAMKEHWKKRLQPEEIEILNTLNADLGEAQRALKGRIIKREEHIDNTWGFKEPTMGGMLKRGVFAILKKLPKEPIAKKKK